jgi:hypothetical protein
MGFIIRSIFWLSLVLLLVPFGGTNEDGSMVSPLQAMFAAKGAIEDISGMCERKPDVCAVGKAAVHTIGVRAREGARLAFGAFDETEEPGTQMPQQQGDAIAQVIQQQDDATVTGSVPASR